MFDPGRQRLLTAIFDQVRIKSDPPRLELRGVDGPHPRLESGSLEMAGYSQRKTLVVKRCRQKLKGSWASGLDMSQLRSLELIAGALEQSKSAAKVGTIAA